MKTKTLLLLLLSLVMAFSVQAKTYKGSVWISKIIVR
ncbi:Uncharacterised protein [Serratia proteamaculans]|nr:Uncharacterised protein [Serratia proteamaculans]CAI0817035.1 Uncharacterised protein [Serratia proteamaculans]